jgi:hypothetical protein
MAGMTIFRAEVAEVVDHAPRTAERDGGQVREEEAVVAVEGLGPVPGVERMEGVPLRDEDVLDRVVVAAAPGEAERVPDVVDADGVLREPDRAELGERAAGGDRRAVLEEDAAADHAVGVQAAAPELPASGHAVAARDAMRLADRRQPPRGQEVQVRVELARHRWRDAHRVVAAVRADHRHPRRRRVVVAEDLHQLALAEDVHLGPAPIARERDPEDAGMPHGLDQRVGKAPRARDLVGGRFDDGPEGAGVREDRGGVEDGGGRGGHAPVSQGAGPTVNPGSGAGRSPGLEASARAALRADSR